MSAKSRLIGKDPDAGKDWRQEEKGMTEEMVGWHHQLNEHKFKQTLGDSEGQGSLVCCSPWGHKESDITEQQRLCSWTESRLLELRAQRQTAGYPTRSGPSPTWKSYGSMSWMTSLLPKTPWLSAFLPIMRFSETSSTTKLWEPGYKSRGKI